MYMQGREKKFRERIVDFGRKVSIYRCICIFKSILIVQLDCLEHCLADSILSLTPVLFHVAPTKLDLFLHIYYFLCLSDFQEAFYSFYVFMMQTHISKQRTKVTELCNCALLLKMLKALLYRRHSFRNVFPIFQIFFQL